MSIHPIRALLKAEAEAKAAIDGIPAEARHFFAAAADLARHLGREVDYLVAELRGEHVPAAPAPVAEPAAEPQAAAAAPQPEAGIEAASGSAPESGA